MKSFDIDYKVEETNCRGFMIEPKSQGNKLPGIVMYTDFWGINARQKKVAEKLANMGAFVLIADMYGNQQFVNTHEEAAILMQSTIENDDTYTKRILAPYELLKRNINVDLNKLFSIGYCFGGMSSLLLARLVDDLCGSISVHGLLKSKLKVLSSKKMPKMLILHGARDPLVPEEDVKLFQQEMNSCNSDYIFITFGLCIHAFSNSDAEENKNTSYNYIADKRSDYYIKEFLNENSK